MPDQEKTFFLGIIGDSLLGWPPRRVVKGSLSKHRNGDGENAVHDASESSSMAVASFTKSVVVFFEVRVAQQQQCEPNDGEHY